MQYVEYMRSLRLGQATSHNLYRRRTVLLPFLILIFISWVAAASVFAATRAIPTESYRIVHVYPHDANAFTQGLVFVNGMLYESTGLRGQSSLRMVDLASGRVLQKHDLAAKYFGEGLTDWQSHLVQLTWQSHLGFVYDTFSFRIVRTFTYSWEGWGLTHDSRHLILSDGTSVLHLLDPSTFKPVGEIRVTADGQPVLNLNELEYIHGEIYANIWGTNRIARISPATGKVIEWIDLSGLSPPSVQQNDNAVLNGIAYDSQHDRLYVTGKLWPNLYQIKLIPATKHSQ
ncbi:MAG TPA: glutaminyl-peptide cyclotransferase [Acidobacteriaceae bacterium]|nr:glutaminyl-peptide cyclotransferase [Acidobacteriaceae bacterium]